MGRGRGGPGLQEEKGRSRFLPPRAVGCVLGVSLCLPQVSSDGDCILLDLLFSGQAWGWVCWSPEVMPEDQVLLLCLGVPSQVTAGPSALVLVGNISPESVSSEDTHPQTFTSPSHCVDIPPILLCPLDLLRAIFPELPLPSPVVAPAAACSEEEEEEAGFTSLNCQQPGETGPAAGVTPVQRLPWRTWSTWM